MVLRSAFAALVFRRYIASHVRRHALGLAHERRSEGLLRRLRTWLIAHGDPAVSMRVGTRPLALPLSHELPLYYALVPTFDRALPEIARRIRQASGSLVMIDVGANVGDSAALVAEVVPDARVLCIEGSARYAAYLERNVAALGIDATCVRALCAEVEGASHSLAEHGGTASARSAHGSDEDIRVTTLDALVMTQPEFRSVSLLKIDTDGFDLKVLHGASLLLRGARPVVFFEYAEALLRGAGDEPTTIFAWLAELGYSRAELFSNQGVSLGKFPLTDGRILEASRQAIMAGEIHYLDVLAWPSEWDDEFA